MNSLFFSAMAVIFAFCAIDSISPQKANLSFDRAILWIFFFFSFFCGWEIKDDIKNSLEDSEGVH